MSLTRPGAISFDIGEEHLLGPHGPLGPMRSPKKKKTADRCDVFQKTLSVKTPSSSMVLLVSTLSNVLEPYPMVPFAKLMSILATSKGGTELRTEPSSSSKPNVRS
ncbi:hypothetical protein F2Q69_00027939 [Brassica cretica]|uniref:Uncharacterized protein n=1 Tax=Brassica cretica TaxID=69181 RepID=A0A8S9RSP8_BRACR|nr:hypothetical protein F2Q69_00027939 [Brassica cretica]